MTETRKQILEALTDDQIERMKDGKEIEVLVEKREPFLDHDESNTIDTITLQWNTKGVVNGDLNEHFDHVHGIGDENE